MYIINTCYSKDSSGLTYTWPDLRLAVAELKGGICDFRFVVVDLMIDFLFNN